MIPDLETRAARTLLNAGWNLDDVLAVLRPDTGVTLTVEFTDVDFADFGFTAPSFAEFVLE